jgi:NAD-dependent protein deacetylase/lipoamidase
MMTRDSQDLFNQAASLLVQSKYAIAFTGAGISTSSGIPDFRSPDCGLWNNVDSLSVASIYGFRQNPQAFYDWVRPLAKVTVEAKPNPVHFALADLESRNLLKAVITQNIDMLHTRAGSKTVYELHGHLREATCIHCFAVYPGAPLIAKFIKDGSVPHCPKCGGVIKPNLILFGEQLPAREMMAAKDAARHADVVFIIGSSLEVAPASDIPLLAQRNGAKVVIINLEPTPFDSLADIVIQANAAAVLPQIVHCMELSK